MIKYVIKYDVYDIYGTIYRYNPAVGVQYYIGIWHHSYASLDVVRGHSRCKLIARNVVFKKG